MIVTRINIKSVQKNIQFYIYFVEALKWHDDFERKAPYLFEQKAPYLFEKNALYLFDKNASYLFDKNAPYLYKPPSWYIKGEENFYHLFYKTETKMQTL